MSEELKPCPFCGHTKQLIPRKKGHGIMCEKCCAEGPIINGDTSMTWETRPIEDALRAEIERAEARCKSALALYEEYHDANVELRAELEQIKQQRNELAVRLSTLCTEFKTSHNLPSFVTEIQYWFDHAKETESYFTNLERTNKSLEDELDSLKDELVAALKALLACRKAASARLAEVMGDEK